MACYRDQTQTSSYNHDAIDGAIRFAGEWSSLELSSFEIARVLGRNSTQLPISGSLPKRTRTRTCT